MKSRNIIAGWTAPGSDGIRTRVELAVELQTLTRQTGHTIDHQPVAHEVLRFSMQGTETEAGMVMGGGQISDTLRRVEEPSELTLAECAELADLWDRWHLNDMRAGCIHQTEAAADIYRRLPGYGSDKARWIELRALACPEGYKYGDEWLVEYLPPEVEQRIRQLTGMVEVPA